MTDLPYIKANYDELRYELEDIASKCGVRTPTLVAVTKSGSDEELCELVRAGAVNIGENRPQELRRRADILYGLGYSPILHEIGTLQRNKVKLIIKDVALIHSLDSLSLEKELNKQGEKLQKEIRVLIEINSAQEVQKSGVLPDMADEFLASLRDFSKIKVVGLMTMGPATDDNNEIRKYFRLTKRLFDDLNSKYDFGDTATLSMGMSDSYAVAIEEGATHVRVGRKLFNR